MNWLNQLDTDFFLFLNGHHSPVLDQVMEWITRKQSWYPFYAFLVIGLMWKLKKRTLFLIPLLVLAITLADQFSSALLKPLVARLRPCHDLSLQALVHLTGDCGGQYGFASSHAANSFALAAMLYLLFRKRWRWTVYLFVWAIVVSYSRIYVGVHYPLDVIAGAGIGTLISLGLVQIGCKYVPPIKSLQEL
ncbi:MAG: phosphatase PAP2 family protein [Spirosomataceae bacterium]